MTTKTPDLAEPPPLMTARQVARLTQISESTLAWYRREGGGLPFLKMGRHVRYRRVDVEHFLATGEVDGAPRTEAATAS